MAKLAATSSVRLMFASDSPPAHRHPSREQIARGRPLDWRADDRSKHLNWIDLVLLVAIGLALWSGLARGALLQVFSWGGFFAGLILGSIIAPPIVDAINPDDVTTKAFLGLGVFLGIAFLFEALVAALGLSVRKRITRIGARKVDQIL